MTTEQIFFELNLIRDLFKDHSDFNDHEYLSKMQDGLNKRYGMIEKKKLFSRSTYRLPFKYPILDTVSKAKYAIKKDNMRILFWSKEFHGTQSERQWEKDLSYLTKYKIKQGGVFPKDFRWKEYIMYKRISDENVILPNAYIFIISERSYEHFKEKTEDKKLSFTMNLNDFVKANL